MDRNVVNILKQLVDVVIEETEHNDDFAHKIEQILSGENVTVKKKTQGERFQGQEDHQTVEIQPCLIRFH